MMMMLIFFFFFFLKNNTNVQIVHVDANMNVRKQIMRELQFMHDCNSKHIVSFYGAFMNGGDISICMEYMDAGYGSNSF